MKKLKIMMGALLILFFTDSILSYPYDGYDSTGIRRLLRLKLILDGKIKGTMPPPGGRKLLSDIKLNLIGARGDSISGLPEEDAKLDKKIEAIFPDRNESYSLALLDLTPGKHFRFASRQIDRQFAPGSVGKLAIAAGLFTELQRTFPDNVEKRHALLKSHMIKADRWINIDSHEIPVFDPQTNLVKYRPAKEGDEFSFYEWVDHMLSASANSASSVVWKEAMLLRAFGKDYTNINC